MNLEPQALTVETFAEFGSYHNLVDGIGDIVIAEGDGWRDTRTTRPLLTAPGHLGLTRGSSLPTTVRTMERHLHTREALFCLSESIVLPVAPAGGDRPRSSGVRAFLLEPGDVVVLNEGVWHDACHGISGPVHYYWYATEVEGISNDWISLDGSPVTVDPGPSAPR